MITSLPACKLPGEREREREKESQLQVTQSGGKAEYLEILRDEEKFELDP